MIRIRLTKKLAAVLNGLDVSSLTVGDIIELPDSAAQMMVAEGWAELVSYSSLSPILIRHQPLAHSR
jgi:RNA-binding protein YlmH